MRSRDLALIALFAAFMCVLGLTPRVTLPFVPAPFTTQTLGVLLAGGVLGARRGFLALVLFVVLVAFGLPVVAGGVGGMGVVLGPTGGFLLSFPLGAALTGWLVQHWWAKLGVVRVLVATVAGSLAVYPLGQAWLAVTTGMPADVAAWSWLVYLPGDLIKSAVATAAVLAVKRAYPLISPAQRHTAQDDVAPRSPGDTA